MICKWSWYTTHHTAQMCFIHIVGYCATCNNTFLGSKPYVDPKLSHVHNMKWDLFSPRIRRAIVSHCMPGVSTVEYPTQCLCFVICRIDYSRNMFYFYFPLISPLLNCKVLNIDMSRSSSRFGIIYHIDGSFIIFIDGGWIR